MTPELKEKLIDLYKKVQAIPYCFSLPRDPDLLISKGKGICSEKTMFLAKRFHDLGIPTKFVLLKFDWNTLPIPRNIIAMRKSSLDWHLALKIKLDRRWTYIDATWDPSLEKSGFEVTKWDGISDTKPAVRPVKSVTIPFLAYWLIKKLMRLRENREPEFSKALNQYLQEKREESVSDTFL